METTPKKTKLDTILSNLQFLPNNYKKEIRKIEEFNLGLENTATEKLEKILFGYVVEYFEGNAGKIMPKEITFICDPSKIRVYYVANGKERLLATVDTLFTFEDTTGIYLRRTLLENSREALDFYPLSKLKELVYAVSKLSPVPEGFLQHNDEIIREAESVLNAKYNGSGVYFESIGPAGEKKLAIYHEGRLFPSMIVFSIDRIKIGEVQVSSKFGGNFPIEIGEDGSYKEVVEYAVKAAKRTIDMISNVIALAKLDGRPFRIMMLEDILSVENPETKDVFIQAYYPSEIIYNRTTLDMNDLHLMSVVRAKEKAIESPYIFKDYQYCK